MICYGLLLIMFCPQDAPPPPASTFCQIYQPVRWSARDTRGTKEQVDVLNRQWKALCANRPPQKAPS